MTLALSRGVLLLDELLEITSEDTAHAAASTLESLRAEAVVPIVIDDRPEFLLVLGEKLFGGAFSSEDVNFLGAIASQGAMALRNARLHRDLATAFESLQAEAAERKRFESALLRASDEWRATFDSTSEAIVMVDPDMIIVRANLACAALFGLDIRKLPGRDLAGLFRSLVDPEGGDLLPRVSRPGARREIEVFAPGIQSWINVACDLVSGAAAGESHGAVYTLRDVTELKTMQTSILEAKRDWEDCFDTINEAITLHDTDFNIVRANRGAATLLGLPVQSIVGRTCHESYHGAEFPPQGCPGCEALVTGETVMQEILEPHLGKYLEIKALPRFAEGGGVIGLIHVVRDITERKRAEEELKNFAADLERRVLERTAELTEVNRELDSFAYAVSHDLRAPLRAIVGFSSVVLEESGAALTTEARGNLERVVRSGVRMEELIDGLLALSRSARVGLQLAPVDISALALGCLEDLVHQEPSRPVALQVEPGLLAIGDARLVDALLRNLIGNAWKYTAHTPRVEIRVVGRELNGERAFCVSDNGAGFDMALAGKLFQPFQRLHSQDEFPGIGIGLATVQRIVRRHGGRISAEGHPGRGATFCFTLGPSS
jgi:PAS domain S-box-containing protein